MLDANKCAFRPIAAVDRYRLMLRWHPALRTFVPDAAFGLGWMTGLRYEADFSVAAIAHAEVFRACGDVVSVTRWISPDRSFDRAGLDFEEFLGTTFDQVALELIQDS